jgi:hypothetical protein
MVVTAHQPTFCSGASVVQKIVSADAVIWLDEVQHTKNGWLNRNRTRRGDWFTVPVEKATDGLPVNRVRIADVGRWREKMERTFRQNYPACPLLDQVCAELHRPYRQLIALNLAILRLILDTLGGPPWHFQSHLDGGHAVTTVSDDRTELLPISARLARMVSEIGGTTYLSGPSGRGYLDESPFNEFGVSVEYWQHDGPNPCSLELATSTLHRPADVQTALA